MLSYNYYYLFIFYFIFLYIYLFIFYFLFFNLYFYPVNLPLTTTPNIQLSIFIPCYLWYASLIL